MAEGTIIPAAPGWQVALFHKGWAILEPVIAWEIPNHGRAAAIPITPESRRPLAFKTALVDPAGRIRRLGWGNDGESVDEWVSRVDAHPQNKGGAHPAFAPT